MLKTSSEIRNQMKAEAEQLKADIIYLGIFKKHFEEKAGKVFDKNVTKLSAGNVRGFAQFERYSSRLNAYKLNAEGCTDYREKQMRDCYINISYKEVVYVPEGKKKEVLNAAAVNAAIDEALNAKRDRLAELETIKEADIIQALQKYNNIAEQLRSLYQENKTVLNYAGLAYEVREPKTAVIDPEGFSQISRSEALGRLDDDEFEIDKETAGGLVEYVNIKRAAFQILKAGGWRENNLASLADHFGYIITGNRDNCTIYPLCVDNYNVMPCASVSISRGVAC